jgi:methionine-gamma-lyase
MKPATDLIHRAKPAGEDAVPLTTPIYETTTFVFESADEVRQYNEGRSPKFLYSRYANPTVTAVERTMAVLEGAEAALVLSSGQAATTTALLALMEAGDEIICSSAIYGGTLHLIADLLAKFNIAARFVSIDELHDLPSVISERTKLVWFESPINPTLRCVDIGAVASACRARGVISAIDNTFASPINQQPIGFGVDLVMHSATKYLNGHSDVTAGVVAGPARLIDPILDARKKLGTVLDPYAAYALGRGLKTLGVRMERHNATIARRVSSIDSASSSGRRAWEASKACAAFPC